MKNLGIIFCFFSLVAAATAAGLREVGIASVEKAMVNVENVIEMMEEKKEVDMMVENEKVWKDVTAFYDVISEVMSTSPEMADEAKFIALAKEIADIKDNKKEHANVRKMFLDMLLLLPTLLALKTMTTTTTSAT